MRRVGLLIYPLLLSTLHLIIYYAFVVILCRMLAPEAEDLLARYLVISDVTGWHRGGRVGGRDTFALTIPRRVKGTSHEVRSTKGGGAEADSFRILKSSLRILFRAVTRVYVAERIGVRRCVRAQIGSDGENRRSLERDKIYFVSYSASLRRAAFYCAYTHQRGGFLNDAIKSGGGAQSGVHIGVLFVPRDDNRDNSTSASRLRFEAD